MSSSGTRRRRKERVRWIQHYNNGQKILLVGEGDFSLSACLARAFGSAVNMVATSLHPQELLRVKHWTSEAELQTLDRLGCLILHEVDDEEKLKAVLKYANACGAITTTQKGAIPALPTESEVLAFVKGK
ncbi:Uncharacterized protein LOK49_LG07G02806 [Camellia lanceoleosa]|uniref:Uncharacterized protein n=1 Tax=Camellia lanceoleosa TaxID=1840588 RepID=A0ACC0GZ49_9ERIC|nr:Uncharacterized protein LOK49_LG07G02806 [Camellia lanceoleosa]